jgi:hypothetical protein
LHLPMATMAAQVLGPVGRNWLTKSERDSDEVTGCPFTIFGGFVDQTFDLPLNIIFYVVSIFCYILNHKRLTST